MPGIARFLRPPKTLASCIAAAIYRDTCAIDLSAVQRMNFFPATPLVTLTIVLRGQLQMGRGICGLDDLMDVPPLPNISVALPSDQPTVSWSPGALVALTLAIYPDAWTKLAGKLDSTEIPTALLDACDALALEQDIDTAFGMLCAQVAPVWDQSRQTSSLIDWTGSDRIKDWARHIVASSLSAQRGRSARDLQRTLRRWTGRSRQSLEFYANLENLHRVRQEAPEAGLAQTALDAGFADQSHMGRTLKRATGFSPAALNARIASDEAFWCYRLLGERF